jgi:hypothetical protein
MGGVTSIIMIDMCDPAENLGNPSSATNNYRIQAVHAPQTTSGATATIQTIYGNFTQPVTDPIVITTTSLATLGVGVTYTITIQDQTYTINYANTDTGAFYNSAYDVVNRSTHVINMNGVAYPLSSYLIHQPYNMPFSS